MFCIHCGADISAEDTICPNCHAQLHNNQIPQFHQAEEHAPFSKRAYAFMIDLLFIMVLFSLVTSIMRVLGIYLAPGIGRRLFCAWLVERKTGDVRHDTAGNKSIRF